MHESEPPGAPSRSTRRERVQLVAPVLDHAPARLDPSVNEHAEGKAPIAALASPRAAALPRRVSWWV